MQDDLVTVARYATAIEAEIAKSHLESQGIRAFLKNELAIGVMPFLGATSGGVELQVAEQNVEAARDLLAPPPEETES